jgi:hypothetical protein
MKPFQASHAICELHGAALVLLQIAMLWQAFHRTPKMISRNMWAGLKSLELLVFGWPCISWR